MSYRNWNGLDYKTYQSVGFFMWKEKKIYLKIFLNYYLLQKFRQFFKSYSENDTPIQTFVKILLILKCQRIYGAFFFARKLPLLDKYDIVNGPTIRKFYFLWFFCERAYGAHWILIYCLTVMYKLLVPRLFR